MKVYLSPSNQSSNTYCIQPHTEKAVCEEIAGYLREELTRCGIIVYGWQPTIGERIAEANRIDVDIYLAIHTNAHNGTAQGVLMLTDENGKQSQKVAKLIYDEVVSIYPHKVKCRGVQGGAFDEIKKPCAATPYLELAFHDNPEDCRWILDYRREIAAAIARSICSYACMQYVPCVPNKLTPIMGDATATAAQMYAYLYSINSAAPDYAQLYLAEGAAEGVRGDIAFAQSCIETDYWRFGGDV